MTIILTMQYFMRKIFTVVFLSLTIMGLSNEVFSEKLLEVGDQAFEEKNYREALLNYEAIILEKKEVSPLLLEKTVWLSNKLNDDKRSVQYLSLLYKYYPNASRKKALDEKTSEVGVDSFFTEPAIWSYITWSKIKTEFWMVSVLGLGLCALISLVFWWLNWRGQQCFLGFSLLFSFALLWFYSSGMVLTKPLSYINSGQEKYYESPSYASSLSDVEITKNELMGVMGEEGPWLQLSYGSDTLYLPKKAKPFIF